MVKLGLLVGLPSIATYVFSAYPGSIDSVLLFFGLAVAAGMRAIAMGVSYVRHPL